MNRPSLPAIVLAGLAALAVVALSKRMRTPAMPTSTIGPGVRVLHIGDSHTVGVYGTELDRLLRATGATVETCGSSGSSPSWWLDGHPTTMGWVARRADGSVEPAPKVDWKAPHPTPKLADLVASFQPNVVIVSLGANLRPGTSAIAKQVPALIEVARSGGAKVFWVGPPNTATTAANPSSDETFYAVLRDAAAGATFVDSRPFTPSYAGSDGLHFSGPDGTAIAKRWAAGVISAIGAQ